MTVTKADLVAARESIDMIPKEADIFGDSAKRRQAEILHNAITTTYSSPEYWRNLANKELAGLEGDELQKAQKAFVQKYAKEMTDDISAYGEASDEAASGGMLDRYSASAGGLGAAVGAIIGGVFGGKGGALIGALLGGIGLYAAQKLGLGGESLQRFFKGGVDKVLGPAASPIDKQKFRATLDAEVQAVVKQQQGQADQEAIRAQMEPAAAEGVTPVPTAQDQEDIRDQMEPAAVEGIDTPQIQEDIRSQMEPAAVEGVTPPGHVQEDIRSQMEPAAATGVTPPGHVQEDIRSQMEPAAATGVAPAPIVETITTPAPGPSDARLKGRQFRKDVRKKMEPVLAPFKDVGDASIRGAEAADRAAAAAATKTKAAAKGVGDASIRGAEAAERAADAAVTKTKAAAKGAGDASIRGAEAAQRIGKQTVEGAKKYGRKATDWLKGAFE